MTYSVRWNEEAEEQLAHLWNEAEDKGAIAQAANEIDASLGLNPAELGESREHNQRILLCAPLGVLFDVDSLDRVVLVTLVWKF